MKVMQAYLCVRCDEPKNEKPEKLCNDCWFGTPPDTQTYDEWRDRELERQPEEPDPCPDPYPFEC